MTQAEYTAKMERYKATLAENIADGRAIFEQMQKPDIDSVDWNDLHTQLWELKQERFRLKGKMMTLAKEKIKKGLK